MCRVFEFYQYPELLSCDYSCYEIFNVVIDLVVCHCSDYDVVVVWDTVSTIYYEIQPFVCHAFEIADRQSLVGSVFIDADRESLLPHSPSFGLSLELCAIESFSKIFCELSCFDFRFLYFYGTSVEYSHNL